MITVVTLPDGDYQLPSRLTGRVRPMVEKGVVRFSCGRCRGHVEAKTGYGPEPDELLCMMCGSLWFGYVVPAAMQRSTQAKRLRSMAELDDRRSTEHESMYDALRRRPENWK